MKNNQVRWGIIGTGAVADQFCSQLSKVKAAVIARVLSRSEEKARAFATRHRCMKAGSKMEDFFSDKELDAVYIASSTRLHEEHTMLCLEQGLAVVCEKPFVTSAAALDRIAAKAREQRLFCMEGMWMRFNPLVRKVKRLIDAGQIGEIKAVHASIGYKVHNLKERLSDSQRGALWDFSVYGVSFFEYLLGTPLTVDVQAIENTSARGLAAVFKYPQALATLISSIEADLDNQAIICGTEGALTLTAPFFAPTELRASRALFPGHTITDRIFMGMEAFLGKQWANTRHRLIETNPLSGFYWQAEEATQAIISGKQQVVENSIATTGDVIRIIEAMNDDIESR